jgi:uncharacterized glyoxalase superfamily protein PhnB
MDAVGRVLVGAGHLEVHRDDRRVAILVEPRAMEKGRPMARITPFSFSVDCRSQEEVDRFWTRLSDGGEEGRCSTSRA